MFTSQYISVSFNCSGDCHEFSGLSLDSLAPTRNSIYFRIKWNYSQAQAQLQLRADVLIFLLSPIKCGMQWDGQNDLNQNQVIL